jgi:hypothetical protein
LLFVLLFVLLVLVLVGVGGGVNVGVDVGVGVSVVRIAVSRSTIQVFAGTIGRAERDMKAIPTTNDITLSFSSQVSWSSTSDAGTIIPAYHEQIWPAAIGLPKPHSNPTSTIPAWCIVRAASLKR